LICRRDSIHKSKILKGNPYSFFVQDIVNASVSKHPIGVRRDCYLLLTGSINTPSISRSILSVWLHLWLADITERAGHNTVAIAFDTDLAGICGPWWFDHSRNPQSFRLVRRSAAKTLPRPICSSGTSGLPYNLSGCFIRWFSQALFHLLDGSRYGNRNPRASANTCLTLFQSILRPDSFSIFLILYRSYQTQQHPSLRRRMNFHVNDSIALTKEIGLGNDVDRCLHRSVLVELLHVFWIESDTAIRSPKANAGRFIRTWIK